MHKDHALGTWCVEVSLTRREPHSHSTCMSECGTSGHQCRLRHYRALHMQLTELVLQETFPACLAPTAPLAEAACGECQEGWRAEVWGGSSC